MNLLIFAVSLSRLVAQAPSPVMIGTHYTDGLAGLAVYRNARESVLLNIGWLGSDGKPHQGYNALSDAMVRFREAAADDSYHRIFWKVGSATITYEWGLVGNAVAIGRITSDGKSEIHLNLGSAWPGSTPVLISNPHRIVEKVGNMAVSLDITGQVMPSGDQKGAWNERFLVDSSNPILFTIGTGNLPSLKSIPRTLASARQHYTAGRLWAEGDWGDFLSPIEDQLGNSKVYSIETGRLAHIVSRRWCLPDGQVLFCWDSFFNGLLSSLEDPAGAKNTVRAVLAGETPDGFVPNFSGRGWGTSFDRSQPPVGSYCVWMIHQRQPDLAFLREAYPKLLRWHKWWFSKGGLRRDGNHDGLLEWGSETGDLQNAKYESGLDDSPMFDDGQMVGPNMNLDSTDLSSLWALDADYLSRIADAIGKPTDAKALRDEKAKMAKLIDEKLWDPTLNAYCYRYWTPRKPTDLLDPKTCLSASGMAGLFGEYFHGRNLQGDPTTRHDDELNFNWTKGPLEGFGQNNFSARWTGEFLAPKTDPYIFKLTSDDGCRMWLDGKKIIDAWTVHGATTYSSAPINFAAGTSHAVRIEYFQAEGGAEIRLAVERIHEEDAGQVFSTRLSPLNFYPLMADAPSKERARKTLDVFFKPTKFNSTFICPTISIDDPAFPAQGYWRGTVWGPTSYLTFLGIRKYATTPESVEYAEKSVKLFMKNWIAEGTCRENFNVKTGKSSSDPHYTWGALMCLLGLEELCGFESDGKIRLNGNSGKHIKVHNLRLGGRLYDLAVEPRRAVLSMHGRIVAEAKGQVAVSKL